MDLEHRILSSNGNSDRTHSPLIKAIPHMYIYIYKYYIYILYTPSQLGSHGMLSTAARLARSNDERSLLEELRSLEENLWRLLDGRRKEHQRTSNPASHVGQKNVI